MAAVTSAGRATGFEPLELPADSGAATLLFERHAGRVFGYCLSRLGRREDAEDAVQTTFLHAVRSLRRGVVPLVESAWLLGIARNVCCERWEAAGRRKRIEAVCDPAELERAVAAPQGPNEELIGLEEALERLPEQQRRAVLLRDWRGLSYDEIATQLGVSHAAVETLIFRGRRTLAEQLREGTQAARRRLASLGNLGSLFSAVKSAITGAAAATKLAVAVTATVVGTGAALSATSSTGGTTQTPSTPESPVTSRQEPVPAQGAPRPAAAAVRQSRTPARAAVAKAPSKTHGRAPIRASRTTPALSSPAGPSPASEPAPTEPRPETALPPASVVIAPAKKAVTPLTTPLDKTVDSVVPDDPVATVAETPAAVTETADEAVGTVTSTAVEAATETVSALPPLPVAPPQLPPAPPLPSPLP